MNINDVPDLISRGVPGFVIAAAGVFYLMNPSCFAAVCPYFANLKLDEPSRDRLDEVLIARKNAENIPTWLGIVLGVLSLLLAALELVPAVPAILPYALWCVAFAVVQLASYLYFKHASEKRVAVLRPRRPLESLPLAVIVAQAVAVLAMLGIAVVARDAAAVLVAAAAALTIWIGWRIATAPAIILGNDVAVEGFVDDRLRVLRAVNTAGMGIAPIVVYIGMRHAFTGGTASLVLSIVILIAWLPSIAMVMRTNMGAGVIRNLNAAMARG